MVDHGDDVGGHVRAVGGHADDQRGVLAGGDDKTRLALADHGEAERANEARRGGMHRLQQDAGLPFGATGRLVVGAPVPLRVGERIAFGRAFGELQVCVLHQVRDDLGIGLGGEAMAPAFQDASKLSVVLYDAIVDDGDLPVTGAMGMGVQL